MKTAFARIMLLAVSLLCIAASRTEATVRDGAPDAAAGTVSENQEVQGSGETMLPCLFFDREVFRENLKEAVTIEGIENAAAASVPHHAPQLDMCASVLISLSKDRDIKTVYIAAPNHSGEGAPVQISGSGFYWDCGSVKGDMAEAVRIAKGVPDAVLTDAVISTDHSAQILAPYIAEYLPEARIVSVLLTRQTGADRLSALAENIAGDLENGSALLLCSIDFSHYQTPETAGRMDAETRSAVSGGMTGRLLSLDDMGAHLDSPEAMSLMMLIGDKLDMKVSESGYRFIKLRTEPQTAASYFTYTLLPGE